MILVRSYWKRIDPVVCGDCERKDDEKVASDLGLGGGFRRVVRFPPLLRTDFSRISHNFHKCDEKKIKKIVLTYKKSE